MKLRIQVGISWINWRLRTKYITTRLVQQWAHKFLKKTIPNKAWFPLHMLKYYTTILYIVLICNSCLSKNKTGFPSLASNLNYSQGTVSSDFFIIQLFYTFYIVYFSMYLDRRRHSFYINQSDWQTLTIFFFCIAKSCRKERWNNLTPT